MLVRANPKYPGTALTMAKVIVIMQPGLMRTVKNKNKLMEANNLSIYQARFKPEDTTLVNMQTNL